MHRALRTARSTTARSATEPAGTLVFDDIAGKVYTSGLRVRPPRRTLGTAAAVLAPVAGAADIWRGNTLTGVVLTVVSAAVAVWLVRLGGTTLAGRRLLTRIRRIRRPAKASTVRKASLAATQQVGGRATTTTPTAPSRWTATTAPAASTSAARST